MSIPFDRFSQALRALFEDHVTLPYGVMPFDRRARHNESLEITETDWQFWHWNPPQEHSYPHPDNNASPKPTWQQINDQVAVIEAREHQQRKDADWHAFRVWTRAEICDRIFEAHDLIDEVMKRAKGAIPQKKEDMAAKVKLVHRRHRRNIKQSHPTSKRYQTIIDKAYAAVTAEIDNQLNPPDPQS